MENISMYSPAGGRVVKEDNSITFQSTHPRGVRRSFRIVDWAAL